jgi:hypothetical protein
MSIFSFRYARIEGLLCLIRTPSDIYRSGESSTLSQKWTRLPCGPNFPQTLLICRRPVFPPDRAPSYFRVKAGAVPIASCVKS